MSLSRPNLNSDVTSIRSAPESASRTDGHARDLRQRVGLPSSPRAAQEIATWDKLTPRERDVLYGMARGLSNRAIAMSLGIGLGTVKAHVKRLFLKLGVHDRARAPLVAVGELERAARLPSSSRGQRKQSAA